MAIALRLDTGLSEWIWTLDIGEYYIGVYILIFASLIAFVLPALSCISVYQEISQLLLAVSLISCTTSCMMCSATGKKVISQKVMSEN
mgnify:CR=1 FL=1